MKVFDDFNKSKSERLKKEKENQLKLLKDISQGFSKTKMYKNGLIISKPKREIPIIFVTIFCREVLMKLLIKQIKTIIPKV